jgi:hypothetical protein
VDFVLVAAVLERIEEAEIADVPVGDAVVDALASDLNVSPPRMAEALSFVESTGLADLGGEGLAAAVQHAGRQYLAARGEIEPSVLEFLPKYIDDLNARRALISAGTVLVDEYRMALLGGRGIEFAQNLVPDAFEPAVTEFLALQLYAAAVALLVRLSDGQPAGCVAEEIIAVELMGRAESWIEMEMETGRITYEEAEHATPMLRRLFELFEDDDVLDLFDMEEPADAALAGQSWRNQQAGVADQRIQAWFQPFSWTIATGYLSDRSAT